MQPTRPHLRLRPLTSRSNVVEPTRTRGQTALAVTRETVVVLLAFAAGAGAYIGTLKAEPTWPQDYFGAIGAGSLTALAKMIPTNTGGQNRG